MTPAALLSVIIPARNAALTLTRTLDSLRAQTFAAWEAIVVDDGSTDATAALVADVAAADPRIRLIRVPHGGVSAARNRAITEAQTGWITFLDADDDLEPHHLAALWSGASAPSHPDFVYCDWRAVWTDGTEGERMALGLDPSPFEALAMRCPFVVHAVLARRDLLMSLGLFDSSLRLCEDWDLWMRVARSGARFRHVPGLVARYTQQAGSASKNLDGFLEAGLKVIRRAHSGATPPPGVSFLPPIPESRRATAETWFALWIAGYTIGSGRSAVVQAQAFPFDLAPDAEHWVMAATLVEGIARGIGSVEPDWLSQWSAFVPAVTAYLDHLAPAMLLPRFTRRTLISMETELLSRLGDDATGDLGTIALRQFDMADPDGTQWHPGQTERLLGTVTRGGQLLGRFEVYTADAADPADLAGILADFDGAEPFLPDEVEEPDPSYEPGPDAPRTGSTGADEWERIFAREDPWSYGSDYEQVKREQMLAAVPGTPARALELACAEGHFTRMLAARVGTLLATDLSPTALARASARCADQPDTSFAVLDFRLDSLPPGMDLIVCSEALYYVTDEGELYSVGHRLSGALRPGGHLLLAHANLVSDNPGATGFDWELPIGAATIGETFRYLTDLEPVAEYRAPLYRCHLFRRKAPGVAAPDFRLITIEQSAELPPDVQAHVVRPPQPAAPAIVAPEPTGIPVLAYHRIASDGPAALSRYAVPPDEFQAQMQWLQTSGYAAISLEAFEAAIWEGSALPDKPVLITFDDGYLDNHTNALPVLTALGMPATIFLPTAHIGNAAVWDAAYGPPAPLMGWPMLRDLMAQGISLAAHSDHHLPFSGLRHAELLHEIVEPNRMMAQELGLQVRAMAYPYGSNDEAVQRTLFRAGMRLAFTTESRRWQRRDRVMAIPRIEIPSRLTPAAFTQLVEGIPTN